MMTSKDMVHGLNEMRSNLHNSIELAKMVLEFSKRMPISLIRQSHLVLTCEKVGVWQEAIRLGEIK